jgi:adenylate cyclase, class 2
MKPEIEAKFLAVDHASLRAKLKGLGVECVHPMRLMKRREYDFPDKRLEKSGAWVRVRDEGDRVTLAYKQLHDRTLQGTHEVSMTVDSFEAADAFVRSIGLQVRSYAETKRESWRLKGVEIELDEWPWIRPFIEIEAGDEKAVRNLAAQLGLRWDDALHGSVETAYQAEYDVTEEEVVGWPEVVFGPVPEWLESKRKRQT